MKARYGHCFHGVDYSVPPHELPATAMADASNVLPNHSGLPQQRGGSLKYNNNALSSRITSFFEFRSGTTRAQLSTYADTVAQYNAATNEFSPVITGLASGHFWQWTNFAGKAIGVNEGYDSPQYFTDSSTYGALAGSPPKGNGVVNWANRIWFLGDSTDVALLTGCELNDPTGYAGSGDTAKVSQTVGDSKDPITGGIGFFDMLLVGKQNNIYRVFSSTGVPTAASTLSIRPLYSQDDNVGFTSRWAITQVGNDILFLDGYDIKTISGIDAYGDVEYISIIPHLRDFLKDTVDYDYLKYTRFFHYKKEQQVWVSMPTSSTTYYVFVLDYKFKNQTGRYAFYPQSGIDATCFGGVQNGSVTDIYYGDEDGFVHRLDTGNNDTGTAITSYATFMISGNNLDDGDLLNHEIRKQFDRTNCYIKPSDSTLTIKPYYALDFFDNEQVRTGSYTALDSETVTGWAGTGVKRKKVGVKASGNTLALKLLNNSIPEGWTLYPSSIDYKYKSGTDIV